MANPKIENGKIKYMLLTFDGSYVTGEMAEEDARPLLSVAKTDASVPGYELVSDMYRFETEEVVMKLRSNRKAKEDENENTKE